MNEQYTIEELGLGRTAQEVGDEIHLRIMSGDIVLYSGRRICLSSILDSMGDDFKRNLVHIALDSQNPVSMTIRDAIEERVAHVSSGLKHGIEKPF